MTAAFLSALTASHTVVTQVTPLVSGVAQSTTIPVDSGTVTIDMTAARRRTLSLTFTDTTGTLAPVDASSLLAPFGTELSVARGVRYPNGTTELVQLGVFPIASCEVKDTGAGLEVTISGYDRSWRVSRAAWTDVYQIPQGTGYAVAIQALIQSRVAGLTYNLQSTGALVTPGPVVYGAAASSQNDPWKDAVDLAAAAGMELYFDPYGAVTMAPVSDGVGQLPTWTFTEGAGGTLTQVDRTLTSDATYNHVVVVGSGPNVNPPVRGEATDTNALSPTYILGPYGDVPIVITTPNVATTFDATAMAEAELRRVTGATESVSANAIPNPTLEVGDVVTIIRSRVHLSANYVLEHIEIPLGIGEMAVQCRRVQATS